MEESKQSTKTAEVNHKGRNSSEKGDESDCVSPVKSEEVPESPSMEEAITEEGNPCLSTEQEVQVRRRCRLGSNPRARLGRRTLRQPAARRGATYAAGREGGVRRAWLRRGGWRR